MFHLEVTPSLALTEVRPSDVAALVTYLQEQEIYANTLAIPHPYTQEDAEDWIARCQAQAQLLTFALRNREGEVIGGAGFQDFEVGVDHRAELGYWLARPYWGQGLMPLVVQTLCQFGFQELSLAKITALVFATNQRSARVLEKSGFVQEGYLRRHFRKDGIFIDVKAYGLLAP